MLIALTTFFCFKPRTSNGIRGLSSFMIIENAGRQQVFVCVSVCHVSCLSLRGSSDRDSTCSDRALTSCIMFVVIITDRIHNDDVCASTKITVVLFLLFIVYPRGYR